MRTGRWICVQCGYNDRCEAIQHFEYECDVEDMECFGCLHGMAKDGEDKAVWEYVRE